jgi:predicted nucleic acid-binding Zn ribbon protein
MTDKKDAQPEKIGQVLEKSLKRLDLGGRLTDYGVWPIWNETVGAVIARNAQPERIRNGTLFVSVSSPTWMQQLQFVKEMIADKLNERIGQEIVKSIFFVVGNTQRETPKAHVEKTPSSSPPSPPLKIDESHLSSIKDPEIREALKRLFAKGSRSRARGST